MADSADPMTQVPEPKFPKPAELAGLTLEQKVDLLLAFQSVQNKVVQAGLAALTKTVQTRDEAVTGAISGMAEAMKELVRSQREVSAAVETLRARSLRAV